MAISRSRYYKKKQRSSYKKEYQNGGSRKTSRFKRGYYQPVNESKYRQPQNRHMNSMHIPEYRSSWELAFMKYMDFSEQIEYWGTEAFAITYISPKDNQPHRYFVDFVFMTITQEKHLVEIKPHSQCKDPINIAKWEAAEKFCEKIGATFSVVTEKELKKWNLI